MNKKLLLSLIVILTGAFSMKAQDTWTKSEPGGFGITWNEFIRHMIPFKGDLYAGSGNNNGELYRTNSGIQGTWVSVLAAGNIRTFDALSTTAEGAGYMYASTSSYGFDSARVYRSVDGITWDPYFTSYDIAAHVVPFKGAGSVDSMYIIENTGNGAIIHKSDYASNDPANILGSWQTVFRFDTTAAIYTQVTSTLVHSGRFYIGTSNGAQLWSSMDGINWAKNDSVGFGFGDGNNSEITALEAFGGYIYAGTRNYSGAQLWRTADQLNWTLVNTYPSSEVITDLESTGTELWIAAKDANSGGGIIERTTDGSTFNTSNSNGFGDGGNHGEEGNFALFGNNMYYGVRNYAFAAIAAGGPSGRMATRGGSMSTGGQIWRTCLVAPPTLSLGNDTSICSSQTITLDAGAGALAYNWSTGATTQTISAGPGSYTCQTTAAGGCDASDLIVINGLTSPTVNFVNPNPGPPTTICAGGSIGIMSTVSSGLYILDGAPFNKITHDTISNILGDNYDTLAVSGLSGSCACTSLVSFTIDSLSHTYLGDVNIGLYSPSGSYVSIVTYGYGGSSGAGYRGTEFRMDGLTTLGGGSPPYTGVFLPDSSYANFTGNPNGNWIVKVGDTYGGDDGNLLGWTLKFGYADTIMTYSWTPTTGVSVSSILNPVITPTATTNYLLSVTNAIGCPSFDTVKLIVPTIDITPSPATVCYGSSATLTATGGINYYWSPATFLSATLGPNVNTNATSNIMYYVNDTVAGCAIMDSVYVTANPQLFVTASLPQTICFGTNATLTATGSGGTPGYTYNWNDGATNTPGQSIVVSPTTGTTYTLTALDTNGCFASDFTSVSVTPSTDLVGHAGYSGGNVTSGNAVAFRYYPTYTYFDTVQVTSLDGLGNFTFTALNSGDYLIKIFADTLLYPTLDATYFGDTWAWDTATVVTHGCSTVDTANVTMVEELGLTGGPGSLRGRITEDIGFGSMAAWGSGMGRAPGEPIPGIDVKLGKNPGGAMMGSTTTSSATASDGGGFYYFTNIPLNAVGGSYTVYVDIPGLGRDSSYTVVLDAVTNQYIYLDYIVDSTMIYIVPNAGVGISNPDVAVENKFGVYPNPSKGNATIEYSLTTDATVSLSVYNVLGVKVSDLVNEEQKSGKHKYSINETNAPLNAGVYFITLISNGKTSTQRLIISE